MSLLELVPDRVVLPLSWVGHVPFAVHWVGLARPRTIVELGTHSGNSLCAFAQAAKRLPGPCDIFAVDTWQGDPQAGFYAEKVYAELKRHCDTAYPSVRLLRKTFDEARSGFQGDGVDLLHIDGLHTYEAVRHDFETWLPCMKKSGVVLFHDISERQPGFGVHRFWDEVKKTYASLEFHHSHGLGVLFMPDALADPRLKAFHDEFHQGDFISRLFKALGGGLSVRERDRLAVAGEESIDKAKRNPDWLAREIWFSDLVRAAAKKVRSKVSAGARG